MTNQITSIRFDIEAELAKAQACLNYLWPLTSFVAVNSLKGFEDVDFDLTMHNINVLMGAQGYMDLAKYRELFESGRINSCDLKEAFENYNKSACSQDPIFKSDSSNLSEFLDVNHQQNVVTDINQQVIKWLGAYFDNTQARWSMPRLNSFFESFVRLVRYDKSLSLRGLNGWIAVLDSMPTDSKQALTWLLDQIGVDENISCYLTKHLTQLPGWGSYLKYIQSQAEPGALCDYLAIRLFYEFILTKPIVKKFYNLESKPWSKLGIISQTKLCQEFNDKVNYASVWQDAYEINYRNEIVQKLADYDPDSAKEKQPQCQLVFCIDARSEPLRRQLELLGPYATYGFAGFFGFAMRYKALGSALAIDLCPVLVSPQKNVTALSDDKKQSSYISAKTLMAMAIYLRKRLKSCLVGAFGLVDSFGLWYSLALSSKTFFPKALGQTSKKINYKLAGKPSLKLDVAEFSLTDKINLALNNLKGIGLTRNFAKVVILCGHKSLTTNNPYAAALDCGACGGNPGGISARLAASILNEGQVRQGLADKGISIPAETVFLAAEHTTTTDTVEIFDTDLVNDDQRKIITQLNLDLVKALDLVKKWRSQSLPQSVIKGLNDPDSRSCDWAQAIPELGLARNAAFIVAPRSLTEGIDLDGRAFLHTYDHSQDPSGAILESIMTAPLVVAQMINIQYYLSTVDNSHFGSGSKVFHNVMGDFGIVQGGGSDLKLGLPLQSLLGHEPMRLLVVIRAPIESIDAILSRHENLSNLVKNRWIRLLSMDPVDNTFSQAKDIGVWQVLNKQELNSFKAKNSYSNFKS